MNSNEGLKRIAQVARWSGSIIGASIILISLGTLIFNESSNHLTWRDLSFGAFLVLSFAAFFHYSAKALGWIIDGFAKDK